MAQFNYSRTVFSECSTMGSSMRIPVRKTNVVASALVAFIVSHDHATSGQHRCQWKKSSLCSTARTFSSDVASLISQKITPNFAFVRLFSRTWSKLDNFCHTAPTFANFRAFPAELGKRRFSDIVWKARDAA